VQALDRTTSILPLLPGVPERATHDYTRHGTTNLYAALEVASGKVISQLTPRHRAVKFKRFLAHINKQVPAGLDLHVVVDNYATHNHQQVQAWRARHPRVYLHFTPIYASWLNLVEVFFAIIERQALRRGDFASVQELVAAIRRFCDGWNQRCQPLTWTKDADQILAKLKRQNTSATNH
jgi:transposase